MVAAKARVIFKAPVRQVSARTVPPAHLFMQVAPGMPLVLSTWFLPVPGPFLRYSVKEQESPDPGASSLQQSGHRASVSGPRGHLSSDICLSLLSPSMKQIFFLVWSSPLLRQTHFQTFNTTMGFRLLEATVGKKSVCLSLILYSFPSSHIPAKWPWA